MALVPGFQYDLFISYAHRNDGPPWGWVTQFVEALKAQLEEKSREIRIWWDPRLRTGQDFNVAIADAISESAVFLSILSMAYGDSTYCGKEVEEFRQQRHPAFGMMVGSMSRMQALVLEREYGRERWAPELRTTSPPEFFDKNDILLGRPAAWDNTHPWIRGLCEVRDSIWDVLKEMRKQKESGAVIECSYGVQETRVARTPKLYLADVTDDLLAKRGKLLSALRQAGGAEVVEWAEPTAPSLADTGALSAHLFGAFPGRPFAQAELSLSRLQLAAALAAHPARRPLVWLAKNIDFEEVDSDEHRAFLKGLVAEDRVELLHSDFEDLKAELAERMRVAHKPPPRPVRGISDGPIIHIWHTMQRPAELGPLKQYLTQNNCGVSVFDCSQMAPEKMQSRLSVCDGLIVPYTQETRTWAEDVMMEAFRLRRREARPTAFAAVEMPPAGNAEFNFEHPRVVPVAVPNQMSFDVVGDFLTRLGEGDA